MCVYARRRARSAPCALLFFFFCLRSACAPEGPGEQRLGVSTQNEALGLKHRAITGKSRKSTVLFFFFVPTSEAGLTLLVFF